MAGETGGPVAIQCSLLSRRGGGLPAAILPVAVRLSGPRFLVTHDAPEEDISVAATVLGAGLKASWQGHKTLVARQAALVHTHGLWSGLSLAARRWQRATGGPTIVSPHGMLDPWALSHGGIKRLKKDLAMALVERAHLNAATAVHALNRAEHDAIRAVGITAPIAIIPNGIETAPTETPPPPDWMTGPEGEVIPTLLFLGRLHAKKGIAELIDSWAGAHESLPGWQLAIAGWDDGPNEFRERAARSGVPIHFPGPLYDTEKAAAYAHAAAFVLPSRSEGLPMTVLEAWAHGKPVLMTEACNLPEGFAAGAAARIETDPRAMTAEIAARLCDPSFLSAAGMAGRALVERQFSWEAVTARFEALYAHALGEGERPADLHFAGERARHV